MVWQFTVELFKGVFLLSNGFVQSLPAWIAFLSFILLRFPRLGGKMKSSLEKLQPYAPHFFLIFILISISLTSFSIYKNKEKQIRILKNDLAESKKQIFATPDALTSSILRNMDIRIADLVREDFIIRGRIFENCHIYGPAILGAIGTDNIVYNPKLRQISKNGYFVATTNKEISGAIGVDGCVFKNCTFHRISIIGPPAIIEKMKKDIGFQDDANEIVN